MEKISEENAQYPTLTTSSLAPHTPLTPAHECVPPAPKKSAVGVCARNVHARFSLGAPLAAP